MFIYLYIKINCMCVYLNMHNKYIMQLKTFILDAININRLTALKNYDLSSVIWTNFTNSQIHNVFYQQKTYRIDTSLFLYMCEEIFHTSHQIPTTQYIMLTLSN